MPDGVSKSLIARRFGRSASVYESVTPVQATMGNHLLDLVCQALPVPQVRHVLELGCGTGRLTRKLIKSFPQARIIAVDICPEMVTQAAHKLNYERLELFVADAEEIATEGDGIYDLIISNATVQWFTRPQEALQAYRGRLKPNGRLAFSTFGPETFSELSQSFAAAYSATGEEPLPHVVSFLSVHDLSAMLPGAQILEQPRREEFPDVRTFLRHVQQAGATFQQDGPHSLSRAVYREMSRYYETHFRSGDGRNIFATYHLVYVLAGERRLEPPRPAE